MYLRLEDVSGEIYYAEPRSVSYLKQSRPIGSSSIVYKVVLNCGKQIILTESGFLELLPGLYEQGKQMAR